jgi:3-hydroxy acid dehydrogenase/malonic semialdehyde reductase
MDYADSDIRVTEILPGLTRTGFAAARFHGDRHRGEDYYARFPGTIAAADVARAVIFALEQPAGVTIAQLVVVPTREP